MAPLSRDLMQAQIDLFDLLTAMYPGDDEIVVDPSTLAVVDELRAWCGDDDKGTDAYDLEDEYVKKGGDETGRNKEQDRQQIDPNQRSNVVPVSISLGVNIQPEDDSERHNISRTSTSTTSPPQSRSIQMKIEIPLHSTSSIIGDKNSVAAAPPPPMHRIRQPDWMNKSTFTELCAHLGTYQDLFSAIEYLHEHGAEFLDDTKSKIQLQLQPQLRIQDEEKGQSRKQSQSLDLNDSKWSTSAPSDEPLMRVWFYFPSLSTRSKRNDMVEHAPRFGLTGFVLAGKPGVLCVEGTSKKIDAYMSFIKTESWRDIPSHQKKVSERYREDLVTAVGGGGGDRKLEPDLVPGRVFSDMSEITDLLGDRRGERANRGDMKALESWLNDRGLGQAFAKVLF